MKPPSNSTDAGLPEERAGRVGRLLLCLVAAGNLGLMVMLFAAGETRRSAYYVPLCFILLAALSLVLRPAWRANAALLLMVLVPFPWIAEVAVRWMQHAQETGEKAARIEYARRNGIEFDNRSPKQVVEDLRRQGQDAWPAVNPGSLISNDGAAAASVLRDAQGNELQTLGGIANVETVGTNEDGRYQVYASDEHGFQNPPGAWGMPRIDVAAVGDSFTMGSAVPGDRNLVAVVRRRWAATLNLGYGGNGPLLELASLFEYLPRRQPRVVLWVLCEANDLGEDLQRELASPLLRRYWRDRRSLQNLEQRQPEIDLALRGYVEKVRLRREPSQAGNPGSRLAVASLDSLRQLGYNASHNPPYQWERFAEILRKARDAVRGWNGTLYLVYLPIHYSARESWLTKRQNGQPEERRQRALSIGRDLGIPVIDIEPVFAQAGPRLDQFLYPYRGHFTAAGYEAVGGAIVKRLEADGW